ncbi:MAG: cyclic-di-AMP receptor [Anaerolineaceae bacterium]
MKLIIAIIRDTDQDAVAKALTSQNLRVTHIASTGGLLRRGVTTLLIGLEDEQVEQALQIVRDHCAVDETGKKGATLFVLNVGEYLHF